MVKIIYIEHDGTEHPVDAEEVVLVQHAWFLLKMNGKIKCLP